VYTDHIRLINPLKPFYVCYKKSPVKKKKSWDDPSREPLAAMGGVGKVFRHFRPKKSETNIFLERCRTTAWRSFNVQSDNRFQMLT